MRVGQRTAATNGYTFKQAKRISLSVPESKIKQALDAIFKTDGKLVKTDIETDKRLGVDYYYHLPNGKRIGIDLKVRQNNHRKLVVEYRWYNCEKKAWLYASQADYFLFVHTNNETYDFYLVKASDLRELVEQLEPDYDRAWIDVDNLTAAIMLYYDYDAIKEINKNYEYAQV